VYVSRHFGMSAGYLKEYVTNTEKLMWHAVLTANRQEQQALCNALQGSPTRCGS
jgi:hypothetical protein